jgi:hypothetical protein
MSIQSVWRQSAADIAWNREMGSKKKITKITQRCQSEFVSLPNTFGNKMLWFNFRQDHEIISSPLRYQPTGRGFDSRWCHWNFSLTLSFRPHYGPGVDSASNKNKYQEYFLGEKGGRCVGLTTLSPSCADCLEMLEPQPPGTLRACPVL